MKKIFMFLFCVCAIGTAFGAENCEFISDLSSVRASEDAKLYIRSDRGYSYAGGYVCKENIGQSRECSGQVTFVLENGDVVSCVDEPWPEKDHWKDIKDSVSDCTYDNLRKWRNEVTDGLIFYGDYVLRRNKYGFWTKENRAYKYNHGLLTGYDPQMCKIGNDAVVKEFVACVKAAKNDSRVNWNEERRECNCGDQAVWNRGAGRCEGGVNNNTDTQKKSCGRTKSGNIGEAPCAKEQVNAGAARCQGTCNDGTWEKKTIYSCDEKRGYQPAPKNGKCVKKSTGNNGNGNSGGNGSGVTPPAGGNNGNGNNGGVVADDGTSVTPSYECPEITNGYAYWRAQYKDCSDVIAALDELEIYCKSNPKVDGYTTRVAGLESLRDQCKKSQRITKSTATITDASKTLDEIISGLKVNVWKNAEGDFNTARLASDSIAGVVLGTAGGLITSHLVKKGQVKSGFEAIQCTVGGQRVADWGDEFTVGIR